MTDRCRTYRLGATPTGDTRRVGATSLAGAWYGYTVIVTDRPGNKAPAAGMIQATRVSIARSTDLPDTRRVSVFHPQRLVC